MSGLHDLDKDLDKKATDHGNLMDLEVAEVEAESAEVSDGQDGRRAGEIETATQLKSLSDRKTAELTAENHAEAQDSVT
jgi:hypothetical protein